MFYVVQSFLQCIIPHPKNNKTYLYQVKHEIIRCLKHLTIKFLVFVCVSFIALYYICILYRLRSRSGSEIIGQNNKSKITDFPDL